MSSTDQSALLPEILAYTEGDDSSPRFLSRAAFESLLGKHSDAVLNCLNASPRRMDGPLRPVLVDVVRADGSVGVGAVAGHGGTQEAAHGAQAGDGPGSAF